MEPRHDEFNCKLNIDVDEYGLCLVSVKVPISFLLLALLKHEPNKKCSMVGMYGVPLY